MASLLNRPLALACGASLSNRIAKAALTEGLADPATNQSTERHCRLYRRWSEGGAGLLITGNVQVDRRFLERPGNVAIDHNEGIAALRRYALAGTCAGNHLWMQLNHPGRQTPAHVHQAPLAPSAVPVELPGFGRPVAMSGEDILDVIGRFAQAASVARETGFTGVQIHAAHGYLLSQFLNPRANRREDEWGGTLDNRARALLETVRAVRRAVGADFPVAVKLNSSDFQQGGFSTAESLQVVQWLEQEGVDLLEISGGNYEQPRMVVAARVPLKESTRRREAYFLEQAAGIRAACRIPLMVTGGFRTLAAMESALAADEVDVIGLGRPLLVEPDAPRRLLAGVTHALPSPELTLQLEDGAGELDEQERAAAKMWSIQGWFAVQMLRMGDGLDPDPSLSVLHAFRQYQANEHQAAQERNRSGATNGAKVL
ncbi:NADH:flavin oxidoreductase/NADH oxidase family protein [Lacisediminimonas profundi]|uniref:NADH:flavin oxidoreductase/NADH oxidase family protein n=1 Tax=Lacisediminimonas profundi TaxID=2603856 RepID=UPI00124BA805|nr:NADH:flavin oxidoreductase/NADH oxidase family protein [Lacisediminimonas profundi]